jgi:hypothetical protein
VIAAVVNLGPHEDLFQGRFSAKPHLVVRHSGAVGLAPTVRARELVARQVPSFLQVPLELQGKVGIRRPDGAH